MKINELKKTETKIAVVALFAATMVGLTTSNEWLILGALIVFLGYFALLALLNR